MFTAYEIKNGKVTVLFKGYDKEWKLEMYNGDTLVSYIKVHKYSGFVMYDSHTVKKYRGLGCNKFLRFHLHARFKKYGVLLRVFSISPVSDYLLRKLGVSRTKEFEKRLAGEDDYAMAALNYGAESNLSFTHEHQF